MLRFIKILVFLFIIYVPASAHEVVELKIPASNKVIIKFMFRNGSVTDPAGKEGLTRLTTSLVTEGGTKTLTQQQITDIIYPWAAFYYSSSDKEVSIFTFEVPLVFLDKFYPIVRDLMLSPSFAQQDFERVKSNQQNYVDEVIRSSSDEEYSKKALEDMIFRGTNYQHLVAGTTAGLKSITLEDVKDHYKKYFTSQNLTIGIAGNYSAAFLAKINTDVKGFSMSKPPIPAAGKAITPDGINIQIISKDNALGSAIFGGFPLSITRSNDDFAALMIANSWMGEHRKSYSRLYRKLREERSMNYGDYTYIEWYEGGGGNMLPAPGVPRSSNYFSFWIRPVQTAKGLKGQYPELSEIPIGHAHFALRMVKKELDLIIEKGMNQQDFDLTKEFLRSYIKLYIQSPERQLGFLMDSKFYGRKDYITEMDKLLEKTTLQDVNNAIKKYWQTTNMDIVIVTDKSEAGALAESLQSGNPSPMAYSNSLKASLAAPILDEDKEVEVYPYPVKSVKVIDSDKVFRTTGEIKN